MLKVGITKLLRNFVANVFGLFSKMLNNQLRMSIRYGIPWRTFWEYVLLSRPYIAAVVTTDSQNGENPQNAYY